MRKILWVLFIFASLLQANAQFDPRYSMFMYGEMVYNPGAAGSQDRVCLTGLMRNQWTGIDGSPEQYFNGHMPFKLFEKDHGVGLTIRNDANFGFEQRLGVNLVYAYRIAVGDGKLGIGVNGGFMNTTFNAEWKSYNFETNEISEASDPLLPNNDDTGMGFDGGAGAFYKDNNLFVGLSATHLLTSKPKFKQENVGYFLKPGFYLLGGYNLDVKNTPFVVKPSFLFATEGPTSHITFNSVVEYNRKIWGGVSYKIGTALSFMLGTELFKDVMVGYSYDAELSEIRTYSGGSHEVMLRYSFDIKVEKLPERYRSVRFL